jgi:hypothetical protein
MFEPGQQVICVDGSFPSAVRAYLPNLPRAGKVYTVRDLIPAQEWAGGATCAVLLAEVLNNPPPHRKHWGECGFHPTRFRAIEDVTAGKALEKSEPELAPPGSDTYTFTA